jgi:hypothetical protein
VQVGSGSARRRMGLYSCMIILIICDALRRMFAPNSRFLELSLWWMELAVVLLIAFEITRDVLHKRKMRRCHDALFELVIAGKQLHESTPYPPHPKGSPEVLAWGESVKQWSQEAEHYLERNSAKARKLFSRRGDGPRPTETSDLIFYAGFWDDVLRSHITHLESIMGEVEVYF